MEGDHVRLSWLQEGEFSVDGSQQAIKAEMGVG